MLFWAGVRKPLKNRTPYNLTAKRGREGCRKARNPLFGERVVTALLFALQSFVFRTPSYVAQVLVVYFPVPLSTKEKIVSRGTRQVNRAA